MFSVTFGRCANDIQKFSEIHPICKKMIKPVFALLASKLSTCITKARGLWNLLLLIFRKSNIPNHRFKGKMNKHDNNEHFIAFLRLEQTSTQETQSPHASVLLIAVLHSS